jgi:hypothetical protein
MDNKIKEYFKQRLGLTIPVNEAYEEFVILNGGKLSKTEFVVSTHYTGFVRRKQVSNKKYFVVGDKVPNEESLF